MNDLGGRHPQSAKTAMTYARHAREKTMSDSIKPISPEEWRASPSVDPRIIEAINELLRLHVGVPRVVLTIKDILANARDEGSAPEIYGPSVAAAYRIQGWGVELDRPGFNESYGTRLIFTAPRS